MASLLHDTMEEPKGTSRNYMYKEETVALLETYALMLKGGKFGPHSWEELKRRMHHLNMYPQRTAEEYRNKCWMRTHQYMAHLRDKTHACPRFVKSTLDRIGVRSHLIHDEESDVANTMTQMTRVSPFDTDESQHAYAPTTHDGPSSHPPLDESTQANHAPQPRDSDSTSETSSETSETSSYSESSFVPSDHPVCTPSRLKFPTRKCATSLHHTLPHVSAFSPLQNTAHPCNGTASDAAMVAGDDHDDDDDETTYYTSVDSDAVPTHAEPTLLNVPDVSEHEPVPVATRKRKRDDDGLSANEVFRLHARKLEIDREMKLEVLALQREQFEHYRQMHTLQFNFVMWQYKMHLEMEKAYIATTRDIAP